MKFLKNYFKTFSVHNPILWMGVAFIIWLVIFRDYFFGVTSLTSDAVSYYDHTRFFLASLKKGVFPLWDYFWQHGSPNDLFLRRLGVYSPLYTIILFLNLFGCSAFVAHLLGMCLYFFSGCVAFYLLVKRIYQDERVAFAAFLLFLFSAVGTRIFDSYMCLVIVPTLWFFYFAYAFLSRPERRSLAGLTLSLSIALNTYIPLFFGTIVIAVSLFWVLIFPDKFWEALKRVGPFFRRYWDFSLLMLLCLCAAFVPPISFFLHSAQGGFVMPNRHLNSTVDHVLGVNKKMFGWGVIEDLYYTSFYVDLRKFRLALVYVPVWGVVLWFLGVLGKVNRRVLLYLSLGLFFLIMATPLAAPLHSWLYEHVFYFKYMRNLHFFLWFILIPLFILGCVEFLSQLLKSEVKKSFSKVVAIFWIGIVHACALSIVMMRAGALITVYLVLGMSLFLSLAYVLFEPLRKGKIVFWVFLLLLIVPDSAHVFSYATHNMPIHKNYPYNELSQEFRYLTKERVRPETLLKRCSSFYYATDLFYGLCENVSNPAFISYLTHKISLYDRAEPFHYTDQTFSRLEQAALANENTVFIFGLDKPVDLGGGEKALRLEESGQGVEVIDFHANKLKLKTSLLKEKFLVYADNYAPQWRAFLDGKRIPLYQANVAFKGIRVPAGEHTVTFVYGDALWYAFNWGLWVLWHILLAAVVVAHLSRRREGSDV